ncbi:MAG TPA: hypothetical protein VK790_14600 [Solirubrobacteraceae bacterium]|nr:hypothetical protein [Solirubrobacteraceae bacterium]
MLIGAVTIVVGAALIALAGATAALAATPTSPPPISILKTATLLSSVDQPEGLAAPSQGNAQTTALGNLVVGWGALPYFSEFDRSGKLLFNAQFPAGVNTYRAYQSPWPPSRGFGWPFGH